MDSKTILIVDDEEAVLYVLRNSLLKFGHEYRILTAQDGKSALRYFEKYQIDLVITDYRMNGMNGLELIETICNVQPSTRIILITAFGSDEVEAEATRHNVFAYLKKPLDLITFRQTVKNALGNLSNSIPGVAVQTASTQSLLAQSIEHLQKEISATSVMIADIDEKTYQCVGDCERLRKEQLVSFLNTSLAIAEKAGEFIEEEGKPELWIYRHGSRETLFASHLDTNHILVILISSQTVDANKDEIFRANYSARTDLQALLTDSLNTEKEKLFGQGFNQAVQTELDKIFEDELGGIFPSESQNTPTGNANRAGSSFTMTYEEALAVGLILPTDDNTPPETR